MQLLWCFPHGGFKLFFGELGSFDPGGASYLAFELYDLEFLRPTSLEWHGRKCYDRSLCFGQLIRNFGEFVADPIMGHLVANHAPHDFAFRFQVNIEVFCVANHCK